MTSGLSYRELLQTYVPRPIVSKADYDAAISRINELIDMGDLTQDEHDYLTLLGTLVMVYEDAHYPDQNFELRGVELLKALLTEEGLAESDLIPVFQTQSATDAVLNGQRLITNEQSQLLASFFDLPQDMFVVSMTNGHLIAV